ncbi:ADP-heptose:LPS heptosyltransferase [Streptomyces sp. B4I13]|uniref:glycosyltransferase family 9 protein n=2 Tax=Streptomyces TaxID=1883 RepID=UPI002787F44F|nr:glycosyltransferase family 9 protein [Streptomyces achromogenes]MDQ0834345.1 ADP-heptose:LPS heptosyltransferase [Streptomyces achromogenes]MDQ0958069.1 ADP-heptose:LPS heptosyltransferase [Streptomyces sp. B4I13]
MTTLAPVDILFRPGTKMVSAQAVHTTPLGYDRASIPLGASLPMPAATELVDRLNTCDEIEVSFHGKLGDTLLALATVRALSDWLALRTLSTTIRATGPYAHLISRSGLFTHTPPDARPGIGRRAVIGDREGIEASGAGAEVSLVCDPAAPPCWSSDDRAHPDLPARYYLALERRLGIRLPATTPFAPLLVSQRSRLVEELHTTGWLEGMTIAAITATSWPELKDYTPRRYIQIASHIADAYQTQVRLLVIGGDPGTGTHISTQTTRSGVEILYLDGIPAIDLADVFPHCRLVIGNDTGLTHLAALSRTPNGSGPPVVGLYARHSHSKWRTGLPHHHAVAAALSERMHQGDLCPVRDAITPDTDIHMDAFTPAALAQVCLDLLNGVR